MHDRAFDSEIADGEVRTTQVSRGSTIIHRNPALPLRRVDDGAIALICGLDHFPVESTGCWRHGACIDDLSISNCSPAAIRAILNTHVEGGPAIVVVVCSATPCCASIWTIVGLGVQCCCTSAVAVGLDPINFQTPRPPILSPIAVVSTLEAITTNPWGNCVDVCVDTWGDR